ncbi:MAG: DUF5777 family beta-barrel protein [Flavisolibacter sp.]
MKNFIKVHFIYFLNFLLLVIAASKTYSQDSTADETPAVRKVKPVKNTFGSVFMMDNQTVMVPIKGSMQMEIQHRFGTVNNGSKDLYGIFAPANIRLGMSYVPTKNLFVGAGIVKEKMQVDLDAKYSIVRQTPGQWPVSVAYFGNVVIDTRNKSNFLHSVDRFSYFNELMVARKVNENFSVQVGGSLSWMNNVEAYVDADGKIQPKMNNYHLDASVLGRYKISPKSAVLAGYEQPLTQHVTNNPHPNICFGFETITSSHTFQVFFGNYFSIIPQNNAFFNQNDYTKGEFLIGFNITRVWNY